MVKTIEMVIEGPKTDRKYSGSTCCSPREYASHMASAMRLRMRTAARMMKRRRWRFLKSVAFVAIKCNVQFN